jgi:hypothetical protein
VYTKKNLATLPETALGKQSEGDKEIVCSSTSLDGDNKLSRLLQKKPLTKFAS